MNVLFYLCLIILSSFFIQEISAKPHNIDKAQTSFLSQQELSQKLVVKTHLKQWTLTYSPNKIAIKGYAMDLSLQRKTCNAHILDRFNKDIEDIINKNKKSLKKDEKRKASIETLEVIIKGQSYFVDGRSKIGLVFMAFPKEIIRMKWEEKLNCEKAKL